MSTVHAIAVRSVLAERYVTPLPQLTEEMAMLAALVGEYLKQMGAVWK